MKIRNDILRTYRNVHSWIGIICSLFLFVAFYAGAISMFEQPLQAILSPATGLPDPVSLERTPELLAKVFKAYPEARNDYTIVLTDEAVRHGRMHWTATSDPGHTSDLGILAALRADGSLVTAKSRISQTAYFIDVLHQQVGLPLSHGPAMIIMGLVALLYALALISGVVVYLPTIARTLFAVRVDSAIRKRWLDFHNLLGFFSLPFHIVMALTAVVFAFHGEIFSIERLLFSPHSQALIHHDPTSASPMSIPETRAPLPTTAVINSLKQQVPGFVPDTLNYTQLHDRLLLLVTGHDDRYSLRGPTEGFARLNPYTGRILSADYLPGYQSTGFAILTAFFALHFGSFGGLLVRWGYMVLGLGGAFLFYTGNRIWIVSRRRRERDSGSLWDMRGTRFLEALTSGCTLGCIAGISALLCISPFLSSGGDYRIVSILYYVVFAAFVVSGFIFPSPVTYRLHLTGAGMITLCIPVALIMAARPVFASAICIGLVTCSILVGGLLLIAASKHSVKTNF